MYVEVLRFAQDDNIGEYGDLGEDRGWHERQRHMEKKRAEAARLV